MRLNVKWITVVMACFILAAVSSPAGATTLNPGDKNVTPDAIASIITGATVKAETKISFDVPDSDGSHLIGTVYEVALQRSTGTYDFLFQITVDGKSDNSVTGLSEKGFAGFKTDVSAVATQSLPSGTTPFATGDTAPDSARRSKSEGDVVTFDTDLGHGDTSYVLIIKTDATDFKNVGVSVEGSQSYNFQGFGPQVPEPASLVLFGGCFMGLGGAYCLRLRKRPA
jgi:hypothetical protein